MFTSLGPAAIHCLELRPPLHGTMIGSGTTYGSVIRFVCNDGFKVVGSAERTCQADRTWSGQDAFCEGQGRCCVCVCW